MSAPASLPALVAEIERRGAVPRRLVPAVVAELREAARERDARLTVLRQANDSKAATVRAAIHRAAGEALTEKARRDYSRRWWAGCLWEWLKYRYPKFGLEQRPCKRTIRAALKEWTPPNGGAPSACSNEHDRSGKE